MHCPLRVRLPARHIFTIRTLPVHTYTMTILRLFATRNVKHSLKNCRTFVASRAQSKYRPPDERAACDGTKPLYRGYPDPDRELPVIYLVAITQKPPGPSGVVCVSTRTFANPAARTICSTSPGPNSMAPAWLRPVLARSGMRSRSW